MDLPRQTWTARLALAAFAALCLGWLGRLDYARKISTDVLDLIPPEKGFIPPPDRTAAWNSAAAEQFLQPYPVAGASVCGPY